MGPSITTVWDLKKAAVLLWNYATLEAFYYQQLRLNRPNMIKGVVNITITLQ